MKDQLFLVSFDWFESFYQW